MFERVSDRWKNEASSGLRLIALAAASAAVAAVTLAFLCAAAFVAALDRYGLVVACLVGAGVFLAATLALLAAYATFAASRRREASARAAAEAQSLSPLVDPRLILLGLQIAQAIGIKRLLPILAVGAAAFALARPMAKRRRAEALGVEPRHGAASG
jgi:MFS family permease